MGNKILQDDLSPYGTPLVKSFNKGAFCWRVTGLYSDYKNSAYPYYFTIDVVDFGQKEWKEIKFVFESKDANEKRKVLLDMINKLVLDMNNILKTDLGKEYIDSVYLSFKNIFDEFLQNYKELCLKDKGRTGIKTICKVPGKKDRIF